MRLNENMEKFVCESNMLPFAPITVLMKISVVGVTKQELGS